jgi:hypothetical protein
MAEKRYFVLRKGGKDTNHVYTGRQPHQAALKAATDGVTDIQIRERGAKKKKGMLKVHVFKGQRVQVAAPADRPSWLPAKVWKPKVKKTGIKWEAA